MIPPLELLAHLHRLRWVDLTHAFEPGIPHSPLFDDEQRSVVSDHDVSGGGFLAHRYAFVGQWGTHVDPPAHFVQGLRFQDEIPITEMILPLVVLDIADRVREDPDACVTLEDLERYEATHGRVAPGSFAALRTGWADRWPDPIAMRNIDATGISHTPGWSAAVLRELFEARGIQACGHDTVDTDPGLAASRGNATLERYVLSRDRWQLELLANLEQVPASGAILVATWPKAKRGSGFPARAFAIYAPSTS